MKLFSTSITHPLQLVSLICIFILSATSGEAQIKITSSNMPSSGDTIRYSVAPVTALPDLSKTGTNQIWDFSKLPFTSQGVYEYKSSFKTPYILNFGFTAIGLKIADTLGTGQMQLKDVYDFYKKSSSKWENVGLGFRFSSLPLPQAGKHSDPDEIYIFPLEFGDTNNTTFSLKVPLTAIAFEVGTFFREGTRQTIVDGWGKISTPYASNVDCIRVKAIINSRDSVSVTTPPLNMGIDTRQVVYQWLSTSEKIPMLEITGTEVAGNFVPQQIRYRDKYRAPAKPVDVDFVASDSMINKGETISITNKTTGFMPNYKWIIDPNTGWNWTGGSDANTESPSVTFSDTGKYTVKLVAQNFIGSDSLTKVDYIIVSTPAGVRNTENSGPKIYPNPSSGRIQLTINGNENFEYRIISLTGAKVASGTLNSDNSEGVWIDDIAKGTYLVIFESDHRVISHRLLVR